MKNLFFLFIAITAFARLAEASTYDERARLKSRLAWERQLGMVAATKYKDNRRKLRLLGAFIARHGGAVTDPVCSVSVDRCYAEDDTTTICVPMNQQSVALSSINPDTMIRISRCQFDLRDGLACQTQGLVSHCYDTQLRYRSFKLGK